MKTKQETDKKSVKTNKNEEIKSTKNKLRKLCAKEDKKQKKLGNREKMKTEIADLNKKRDQKLFKSST